MKPGTKRVLGLGWVKRQFPITRTRVCLLPLIALFPFFCFPVAGREAVRLRSESTRCCVLPGGFQPRQFLNDVFGGTYVTGHTFNPTNDEQYSAYDILTIKFDGAGNGVWTNRYDGGRQEDDAGALALDGSGNVFVVGASTLLRGGPSAIVTLKYSADGAPLWTNFHYGRFFGENYGRAVIADAVGNVIVAGLVASGSDIVKYSAAGVGLWTNQISAEGFFEYLAADSQGNVLFVGTSGTNGITGKYAADGAPLWTNYFTRNGWDRGAGVAVDSHDNVVALFSSGIVTVVDGGYTLYTGYAVAKYAPDGAPVWTNRFDQPGVENFPQAIITDRFDAVYAAGTSTSAHLATIKFAASGAVKWISLPDINTANFDTPSRFLTATPREVVLVQDYQSWSDGFVDYVLAFDYLQRPAGR